MTAEEIQEHAELNEISEPITYPNGKTYRYVSVYPNPTGDGFPRATRTQVRTLRGWEWTPTAPPLTWHAAPAATPPKLRIMIHPTPGFYAVRDEDSGMCYKVPARQNGWLSREILIGSQAALEPAGSFCFAGLGCPHRRPWLDLLRDDSGRN